MPSTAARRLPRRAACAAFAATVCGGVPASAQGPSGAAPPVLPAGLETCAQLRDDAERLACYDRFVAPRVRGAAEPPSAPGSASAASQPSAAAAASAAPRADVDADGSYLDAFWELTPERKRGLFNFDGYRPNYFFPVHVVNHAHRFAGSPTAGRSGELPEYERYEAKFQLSIRTKLAEGLLLPNADLWFSYTQQSLWQIYSAGISRPFRAIDHEPELFYIVPTPYALPFGLQAKMVGVGLAHQSNGDTRPFSRSWNRWYVLGGVERGDVALTARFNTRFSESGDDDNPDFTRFRGRTELLGLWTPGFYTLSALVKTSFRSDRGSLQIDATMPVDRRDPKGLRWYAQLFSGYGETLIDYNFRQTSLGLGVSLFGW